MVTGWEAEAELWQQIRKHSGCLGVKQESARTGVGLAWVGLHWGFTDVLPICLGALFRQGHGWCSGDVTCNHMCRFFVGFPCDELKCHVVRGEWSCSGLLTQQVLLWEGLLPSILHPCRLSVFLVSLCPFWDSGDTPAVPPSSAPRIRSIGLSYLFLIFFFLQEFLGITPKVLLNTRKCEDALHSQCLKEEWLFLKEAHRLLVLNGY